MSKKNSQFWDRVNGTLDVLVQKYPKAFFPKDSTETKPLQRGIFVLVTGQNREIPRTVIGACIKNYTMKTRYLRALATCADRVSLDGSAVEPVLGKHRDRAIGLLAEREVSKSSEKAA